MRPVRATVLLLMIGTLAACGRSGNDGTATGFDPGVFTQRPAPVYRSPPELNTAQATRTQPPLASLLNRPDQKKPVEARRERPNVARRAAARPNRKSAQDVPERDVVDLGLDRAKPTPRRPASRADDAPRALRVAARPTPKPIVSTPRPVARPETETVANIPVATPAPAAAAPVVAAAPLPPRPLIASLPGLGAPRMVADGTPSALPDPSLAEAAIPIGRVPASLGAANIEARESALPVADTLERSTADETGGIGWDEAVALMRAGEVADAIDVGEFEVLMTLCSGRGVLAIQPTPDALAAVKMPEVICGKAASLTSP